MLRGLAGRVPWEADIAIKNNKQLFDKYISNKRKAKENLHFLAAGGNIMTKNKVKVEVLNAFFTSVFNSKTICPQCTQHHELEDRYGEQKETPISQEKIVSDLLHHLDTYKSMELDGIHPRILTELAEVLTKPLSIIYQQSWSTSEVPGDWKLVKVMPIYKQGQKEDLGNYRPDLGA